jgi:tetraacyldisaccharide 4'-kinase
VPAALSALAERTWAGAFPGARALRIGLAPAAAVYGGVVAVRNLLYDAGWLPVAQVPAWVVSIGNIAVGGTGKTPATLWLARRLAAAGRRVAIVARGYGKRPYGVVLVGEGQGPRVDPEAGGDEAVLLARRFAGPVVTAERRAEGAAFACARFGVDTIVLDDGFQHRALVRDADLVLLAADTETGLLPAGPLREPRRALARARALLAVDVAATPPPGRRLFRGHLEPTALVRAGAGGAWEEEPLAALAGRTVVAVAGVARPERFARTLAEAGAVVRDVLRFPDHHPYGPADVVRIAAAAGDALPVTTEKDLVKLGGLPGLPALRALRVELRVEDGDALLAALTTAAGAGGFAA